MFLVMLPSLIMLIYANFVKITFKMLNAATNPIMFFNAYNVYYSQASTTKVHVFRSVLEVKVKGQLTSKSSLLFEPHAFQIHVFRTTILDFVHIFFSRQQAKN